MSVTVNPADLRALLHEAIDDALDRLAQDGGTTLASIGETSPELESEIATVETSGDPKSDIATIEQLGGVEYFNYRWPSGDYEEFWNPTVYSVRTAATTTRAVLGWTTRHAWGADRERAVVFEQIGGDDSPNRWYPWTEFVETDDGRYAASLPNRARPRMLLTDGDPLPRRYRTRTVVRADALFRSIRQGPSLRFVVGKDEDIEMVLHGAWVAKRRLHLF